jgi:hypothetical protein
VPLERSGGDGSSRFQGADGFEEFFPSTGFRNGRFPALEAFHHLPFGPTTGWSQRGHHQPERAFFGGRSEAGEVPAKPAGNNVDGGLKVETAGPETLKNDLWAH